MPTMAETTFTTGLPFMDVPSSTAASMRAVNFTGTFEARQEIQVTGSLGILAGVDIILSATVVRMVDEVITGTGTTITVRPDGCD